MRRVRDFDEMVKTEHYIVRMLVGSGLPTLIMYDNKSGTDSQYYSIYNRPIKRIQKNKNLYTLYI